MQTQKTAPSKRNLTEGNELKKLVLFALPLMASNIVFQIYSIIEAVIAGNFIGSDAIAAVGVGLPIIMLFNAIYYGFSSGSEIVISQFYGAKNMEGLKKAANTVFSLAIIVAVSIAAIGFFSCGPILKVLGTPENIIGDATAYLRIICVSMIGNVIYIVCCGVLRGMGDSKWPLYFYICSSGLNILMDVLFVILFGWNVKGLALATVIAQVFSAAVAYLRINSGKYEIRFRIRELKIDAVSAGTILKLALPNSVQQIAMSGSGLVIQFFSNPFGSNFISANNIIFRTDSTAVMPLFAFGMAMTNFAGQNIGAGKIDRVKRGIKSGSALIAGVGFVMGLLMWTVGPYIIKLFTDNPDVIEIGLRGIRIVAFTYVFTAVDNCISGAMRGSGATVPPMVNAIVANLVRIPIAYFLAVRTNDYMGIFYALPFMVGISFIMIISYYFTGRWKKRAIVKAPADESVKAEA